MTVFKYFAMIILLLFSKVYMELLYVRCNPYIMGEPG